MGIPFAAPSRVCPTPRLFATGRMVVFALPQALVPYWTAGNRVRLAYDRQARRYLLDATTDDGFRLNRQSAGAACLRLAVTARRIAALGGAPVTARRTAPLVRTHPGLLILADPFASADAPP